MIEDTPSNIGLTVAQHQLVETWESHTRYEFEDKDVDATMSTMINEGAHLNNLPTMQGGIGCAAVRYFYANVFLSSMPTDIESILISRTVGNSQLVDETILKFTHSTKMNWILPGIEPTGKFIEIPLIVIVGFLNGKVSHEHVYWDQASVLVQLGLIDASKLPVVGSESAKSLLNPRLLPCKD